MKKLCSVLFFLTLVAYSIEDDYLKIEGQINNKSKQTIYVNCDLLKADNDCSKTGNADNKKDFARKDAFLTINNGKCKAFLLSNLEILLF